MAICLEYQTIYYPRHKTQVGVRAQLAVCTLLVVVLIAKVWVKIETTDYGYRLAKSQSETVSLDNERRELALQLSVLKRHDNLLRRGSERLGLQPLNSARAWKVSE